MRPRQERKAGSQRPPRHFSPRRKRRPGPRRRVDLAEVAGRTRTILDSGRSLGVDNESAGSNDELRSPAILSPSISRASRLPPTVRPGRRSSSRSRFRTLEPATNLLPSFGPRHREASGSPPSGAIPWPRRRRAGRDGPDRYRLRSKHRAPSQPSWLPTWWPRPWPPSRSSTVTRSSPRPPSGDRSSSAPPFPTAGQGPGRRGRVSLDDMEAVLEEHDRTGSEHRPDPHGAEAGQRSRPHVGHGPGDGSRVRRPRPRGVDFAEAGHHSRGDRPAPQRARHRQRGRRAGGGGVQSHRRVRHGRPAHHHRAELHHGRRHPVPDQRLHRTGLQQGGDAAEMAMAASLGFDGSSPDNERRQHPGRHRRRPHRPLRQPAHPPGAQRAGLGHPRRAHRRPTSASATGSTACSTTSRPPRGPSPPR